MPTVKPRMRRKRDPAQAAREIMDAYWGLLNGRPPLPAGFFTPLFAVQGAVDSLALLWQEQRSKFLARWVEVRPGTRPVFFWLFDWEGELPDYPEGGGAFLKRHNLFLPGEEERVDWAFEKRVMAITRKNRAKNAR